MCIDYPLHRGEDWSRDSAGMHMLTNRPRYNAMAFDPGRAASERRGCQGTKSLRLSRLEPWTGIWSDKDGVETEGLTRLASGPHGRQNGAMFARQVENSDEMEQKKRLPLVSFVLYCTQYPVRSSCALLHGTPALRFVPLTLTRPSGTRRTPRRFDQHSRLMHQRASIGIVAIAFSGRGPAQLSHRQKILVLSRSV